MKIEDMARQAYSGYVDHADRNKTDAQAETRMPPWEELPFELRVSWQVAVLRVVDCLFSIARHELLRDR